MITASMRMNRRATAALFWGAVLVTACLLGLLLWTIVRPHGTDNFLLDVKPPHHTSPQSTVKNQFTPLPPLSQN